jgi:hypothetical protein
VVPAAETIVLELIYRQIDRQKAAGASVRTWINRDRKVAAANDTLPKSVIEGGARGR